MKFISLKRPLVALLASRILALSACQSLDFIDPNAPAASTASVQALVTGIEGSTRIGHNNFVWGLSGLGREAYYLDGLSDPRWISEYIAGQLDPTGPFVNPFWGRYRCRRPAYQAGTNIPCYRQSTSRRRS
ncbi:MAG: hypothetical protein H9535_18665 [Ignavibacteria bacterium]|nr:hypothetical protein [Ignavibacteria bacterium]